MRKPEVWISKRTPQGVKLCSLCHRPYEGYGNNAVPLNEGRCCDNCNSLRVIPARIRCIKLKKPEVEWN